MEQFDIISLSLVLNFVPHALGRRRMLLRTLNLLRIRQYSKGLGDFVPSLFLVLPAPCVTNSSYLNELRLEAIRESLGCVNVKKKFSNKLVHYLLQLESSLMVRTISKEEIRSGRPGIISPLS
jgi:25S rRNA (adenine2142-N1)-methyltransferase